MKIIIRVMLFFLILTIVLSVWRDLTVTPGSPGGSMLVVQEPIKLHPDNNHYFLYKGKPTVLIGSNEHYGAVLNLDFDYDIYLNELQSKGLNYVRVFSGTYIEPNPNMGSCGILIIIPLLQLTTALSVPGQEALLKDLRVIRTATSLTCHNGILNILTASGIL